ncbi:MAG: two-component system sensor histidine kinase/response regulator, partial [Marmoricola sp.]|nr:two-component system sensor histidine kinase/response regulator [Marmoricola sp.]
MTTPVPSHPPPDVGAAGVTASALPADLMVHLTATINSNLDLSAVLQVVTDTATRLSGATFGAFFYNAVDQSGSSYRLHVLSGADVAAFARMPAPRVTALLAPTFTGSSSTRIADVTRDPRFGGMPRGHLPLRSFLSTPVLARDGETIGALLFGHPEVGVFAESTEEAVRVVAAQAAVAVENARLLAAEVAARQLAEDRAESLELLQEVTSRLATVLSEDDALDALEDTLSRRLGTARMGVYRLEDGAFRALRSKFPGTAHFSLVAWDQPSLGRDAVVTDDAVVVTSRSELADRYPGLVDRLPGIEAGAAIPLRIEGTTFGALVLTWAHPVEFTANLRRMLGALAEQLAGTLERARLYSAEARA